MIPALCEDPAVLGHCHMHQTDDSVFRALKFALAPSQTTATTLKLNWWNCCMVSNRQAIKNLFFSPPLLV